MMVEAEYRQVVQIMIGRIVVDVVDLKVDIQPHTQQARACSNMTRTAVSDGIAVLIFFAISCEWTP